MQNTVSDLFISVTKSMTIKYNIKKVAGSEIRLTV